MLLVTAVVTAFGQQPIDYLLLAVTAVSIILTYTGKNLIAVLHSDSPVGSLSWINLASGLLIALGAGILESVGLYLIEGAILWDIVWKVVLASAFTYLGSTFFAPQHSVAKVRGFISPATSRSLRKVSMMLVLLFAIGIGASAQDSPFNGFFKAVTADQVNGGLDGDKALSGTVLIRPELTIAGNVMKPVYTDGVFTGFESSFATRVGMGVSYSLYKLVNDQPYNVYSFAAQLSFATIEKPNAGILVTASAFNLYGLSPTLGLGYDFVKDSPFKQNYFFMWGLSHTF